MKRAWDQALGNTQIWRSRVWRGAVKAHEVEGKVDERDVPEGNRKCANGVERSSNMRAEM